MTNHDEKISEIKQTIEDVIMGRSYLYRGKVYNKEKLHQVIMDLIDDMEKEIMLRERKNESEYQEFKGG